MITKSFPTLALTAALATGGPAPADAAGPAAFAALAATAAPTFPAESAQRVAPLPRDSLRVFLLTFGPGAAVWERFGHNALWIHDPGERTDIAYHYGLFDMSEEGFLVKFLQGRMFYSMGSADALRLVDAYRRVGRDVTVQELRLGRDRILELQEFLRWNVRPENRVYRYDYFQDNCSTRVRDALDDALGGALRAELSARPSAFTYRTQAVALTAEDEVLTTAMDLGLGPLSDQPITRWELAYVPMRLRDDVRSFTITRDGRPAPLVASERYLAPIGAPDEDLATPPPVTKPRYRTLALLLIGLTSGMLFAVAGRVAARREPGVGRSLARWGLTLGGTAWGLVAGVLGLILLGLWTLTDHEFAWRNENLLQTGPLALALVVLVPLAALRGRARTAARNLGLLLAGLAVLGLLIHPLPVTRQANLPVIALALPLQLGLAWALHRLRRSDDAAAPTE